ncbi:beta-lactamase-like protein [Dunaliella salina]|uniref:Beta-lactamase-like protein n=1 Tax=Dunaliella salina TaxID=3046 RepID=A0ABQ7GZD3_DUNSA|nr:beta-lactamase-like protein [Dunaliella salina]|eukprot:KAF5839966.1 beta-lactamase-like protein [Dunaliella salina]
MSLHLSTSIPVYTGAPPVEYPSTCPHMSLIALVHHLQSTSLRLLTSIPNHTGITYTMSLHLPTSVRVCTGASPGQCPSTCPQASLFALAHHLHHVPSFAHTVPNHTYASPTQGPSTYPQASLFTLVHHLQNIPPLPLGKHPCLHMHSLHAMSLPLPTHAPHRIGASPAQCPSICSQASLFVLMHHIRCVPTARVPHLPYATLLLMLQCCVRQQMACPVVCEATYGVSRHLPREQREAHFLQRVADTLRAGGRVLLPVVALGRAQELLLMLEEHWEAHPELQAVPIYQASGMMRKSLKVYETYQEMLNEDIKTLFMHENPFAFHHVTHLKHAGQFDDVGPCVLMATPSGLQSGVSRDIFEAWCEDRRNTVILCDFAVQGTLAREILGGPKDILTKTGGRKKLNCSVAHISFSAHSDYDQTSTFLDEVKPPHVVLIHGEKTEMMRLKGALEKAAAEKEIPRSVYTPAILQTVKVMREPLRVVRVAGQLAEKPPHVGQHLKGIMVSGPAGTGAAGSGAAPQQLLLHPNDLHAFTRLHRGRVTQRQALATDRPFSALRLALEIMFEGVEGSGMLPVTGVKHQRREDHQGASVQGQQLQEQQQQQQQQQQRDASVGGGKGEGPQVKVKQEQPEEHQGVQVAGHGALQGEGQAGHCEGGRNRVADDERRQQQQQREVTAVRVGDLVTVTYVPECPRGTYGTHVVVEWEGGRVADMVADAVVAVLLRETGDAHGRMAAADAAWQAAKREGSDSAAVLAAELGLVAAVVGSQFGPASVDQANGVVNLEVRRCPLF